MICRGMCSFGNLVRRDAVCRFLDSDHPSDDFSRTSPALTLVRHSGIQPEYAIIAALHIELMAQIWCLLQESNPRHLTYKASALPSELNRLIGGPSRT